MTCIRIQVTIACSSVVSAFASGAIGRGLIPACGEEKFQCRNTLILVSTKQVHHPLDLDVNWMSPMQEKSPPMQVKEPYSNLDMFIVGFHPATRSVQSTSLPIMPMRAYGRTYRYRDIKKDHWWIKSCKTFFVIIKQTIIPPKITTYTSYKGFRLTLRPRPHFFHSQTPTPLKVCALCIR